MKKLAIALLLITTIITLRLSPLDSYLTLQSLQDNAATLKQLTHNNYMLVTITYTLTYALITAFSLPGALWLTLLAGFLFGVLHGTIMVNIGATMGATSAFLMTRYLIGSTIQRKYTQQLATFNNNLRENGIWYLLTLRLIPLFPFFLINILSGLTTLPTRTFIWTTSCGIIPGSLAYTFIGQELSTLKSTDQLLSVRVILALIILGTFLLLPVLLNSLGVSFKREN